MPINPWVYAGDVKRDAEELRARAVGLRESSRDLVDRATRCRREIGEARLRHRASAEEKPPAAKPPSQLERLLRSESDLEAAIAECRAALGLVRDEIRWHDSAPTDAVH